MRIIFALLVSSLLFGCYKGPEAPWGFSLPEGDPEKGELVFIKYKCNSCHLLLNYDNNTEDHELQPPVQLGGDVSSVKTYAELLTSIINPSHKISKRYTVRPDEMAYAQMPNFNDTMKVQELVDLVTFIQPKFTLEENRHVPYTRYNYPSAH